MCQFGCERHAAAVGLHQRSVAQETLGRLSDVVLAFHQHVGTYPTNELIGPLGLVDHHIVDRAERREPESTRLLVEERSARTFPHKLIAHNGDIEYIALRARESERLNVSRVEQIEHAVTLHDLETALAEHGDHR